MSPPPEDHDRERILARRAIFVTTALAALGCSSQQPQEGHPSDGGPAAARSSAPATAQPSAHPTAVATAQPSRLRAWSEVIEQAPPLSVAASLPEAEKTDLEELRGRLAPIYDALGVAWSAAPTDCPPKDCRDKWEAAAAAIQAARDSVKPGLCGDWGGMGYRQRLDEHRSFLAKITKELEGGLADAAMGHGDATTWPKMVNRPPPPQPCLDCAMPQEPGVVGHHGLLAVLFEANASSLNPKGEADLAAIPLDRPLVIRGHADPEEADAIALARARAESVKQALVKRGAKAASLTILSLGSDLPIATSKRPEGKAKNRRVDFAFPGVLPR